MAKAGKRWLYFVHRRLGVATCLLCVIWFLSGLVMSYVPFPSWTEQERVATLPAVDTARVAVLPDAAVARTRASMYPTTFRLEMLGDEPVYRILAGGMHFAISAVTGKPIRERIAEQASRDLATIFPGVPPRFGGVADYDHVVALDADLPP